MLSDHRGRRFLLVKRKYLFPRISTPQFPDLGPVSGAVNHQLSSHLHRSPETWPFWSWLVDCLARNQTSWIFLFLNVNSFFRSADRSLSTSMCVLLSLSVSFSTQNRISMNSPMSENVILWCKTHRYQWTCWCGIKNKPASVQFSRGPFLCLDLDRGPSWFFGGRIMVNITYLKKLPMFSWRILEVLIYIQFCWPVTYFGLFSLIP